MRIIAPARVPRPLTRAAALAAFVLYVPCMAAALAPTATGPAAVLAGTLAVVFLGLAVALAALAGRARTRPRRGVR